eukprot:1004883-Pelagomonas_calceolata.AAC.3
MQNSQEAVLPENKSLNMKTRRGELHAAFRQHCISGGLDSKSNTHLVSLEANLRRGVSRHAFLDGGGHSIEPISLHAEKRGGNRGEGTKTPVSNKRGDGRGQQRGERKGQTEQN